MSSPPDAFGLGVGSALPGLALFYHLYRNNQPPMICALPGLLPPTGPYTPSEQILDQLVHMGQAK